ncbi:hypothetical protein [Dysgonomonas termitidis]|uniref:DUF4116 domain-containing protein n=1 Tax=Dysgonomonas termitidis TaxID=1516126 RepID=A0ABV9KYA3_9BACT
MDNNINIYGNYYLVPDLDPPERKRLLDRLEIDADDIKKSNILHDRENKQWCISGKRIVNDFDFPQAYRENVEIPVYTMSDVEDDRFRMSNGHYSAFFFTTENNMGKATEKMLELGLDYRSYYRDFETKNPSSLFLAFNNTVYPCNSKKHTLDTMDTIGLDWDNFNNPPEPIDELISRQRKNLKALEERCLSYIPYFSRTLPVCMEAVKDNPFNIKDVPGYFLTRKFISDIVEMNPKNLGFIPTDKIDRTLCMDVFKRDCNTFCYIPDKYKTEKMCIEAYERIREDTEDPLRLMPFVENIPYSSVCIDLLRKYTEPAEFSLIFMSIPKNVFNQEIADVAMRIDKESIHDIPDRFISEEMAFTALKTDPILLNKVPDRYKTEEICRQSLFSELEEMDKARILRAIPYPNLILEALKSEGYKDCSPIMLLTYIERDVINTPMAMELIKRDAGCLPDIPFHLKDENICIEAIRGTGDMKPLYAIPKDSMSDKVCSELVNKFPEAIRQLLPEDKKTPELCLMAVKQDESLQKYVPESIVNDLKLNMYRFGMLVEEQVSLNFSQVKDLYEGKKVEIDYTEPTNQIPRKVEIEYNSQKESLNYYDSVRDTKSNENKQKNTIPDKGKGLKM